MVQAYGAADGRSDRDAHPPDDPRTSREEDALLGADATARRPKKDGHASLTSSTSNLANTIIGSGEWLVALGDSVRITHARRRHADLPTGEFVCSLSRELSFKLYAGNGLGWPHPGHDHMCVLGLRRWIWTLSALSVCCEGAPPQVLILRRRGNDVPAGCSLLRRCDRHQMFWSLDQVCCYFLT